jgi:hypothetical protein
VRDPVCDAGTDREQDVRTRRHIYPLLRATLWPAILQLLTRNEADLCGPSDEGGGLPRRLQRAGLLVHLQLLFHRQSALAFHGSCIFVFTFSRELVTPAWTCTHVRSLVKQDHLTPAASEAISLVCWRGHWGCYNANMPRLLPGIRWLRSFGGVWYRRWYSPLPPESC